MPQASLLSLLEAPEVQSPVAWFVLLSTHYAARLASVENELIQEKIRPLRLPVPPAPGIGHLELRACLAELRRRVARPTAFDAYALGVLKGLDRTLADLPRALTDAEIVAGCDGRAYRVRPLVNPIADHAQRSVPPSARQGTMAAYAHRMTLVPVEGPGEHTIACVNVQAAAPAVFKRLLAAARSGLSVALTPFDGRIDYAGLDDYLARRVDFAVFKDPRNESDLVTQAMAAVEAAAEARATLLVFPELALSPAMLAAIRARLASHGPDGHPILTVAGLCHAPLPSGGLHVNEAVLLGPSGDEIWRHRKLRRFTDAAAVPEHIETGFTLGVIETPCGNLATPICLDVFAHETKELLLTSHATVLLVPSLSPKVNAHQTAASEFAADRSGSTFLCNRTVNGYADDAPSFYLVPRSPGDEGDGRRAHLPGNKYLLFKLLE